MRCALELAREAEEAGEVPVGCVVVSQGEILGQARNSPIGLLDPTAHAEMLALRQASIACGSYRLNDATLYCTLEPCPMCAGALVAGRVRRVVFGASDPRAGACGTLYNLCTDPRLNHEVEVTGGVAATTSGDLLSSFFAEKRGDRTAGSAPSAAGHTV